MAFSDYLVFPCRVTDPTTGLPIAAPLGRAPQMLKDTSGAQSGNMQRLTNWTRPLWTFSLSSNNITATERATLESFWAVHCGTNDAFLFRDPDFYAQASASVGTGDGATKVFLLKVTYSYGGRTFTHNASMLKASSLVIKIDNVATTDYTVNAETGVLTFNTAPGSGKAITWAGEFYRKCVMDSPPQFSRTGAISWDATYTLSEVT